MRAHLLRAGSSSLAVVLLTMVSTGHAQTARPWVDPPSDTGSAFPSPSPAQAPAEAKPSTTHSPTSSSAAQATGTTVEKKDVAAQEASPSKNRESASKASSKKAASASKTRQRNRATTVRSDRSRQSVQRREYAGQPRRGSRAEQIRNGVNSGLEVMTLRTIEFPDGRRVQILTRPRPGTVSEIMASPY